MIQQKMKRAARLQRRSGQAITEYLIIVAAILLVVVAIAPRLGAAIDRMFSQTETKVDEAGTVITGMDLTAVQSW